MKRIAFFLSMTMLAIPPAARSQSSSSTMNPPPMDDPSSAAGIQSPVSRKFIPGPVSPLSRVAIGGGISPMGIHLLMATNLNRHLDVRGNGNFFKYSVNSISVSGFTISPQLNLASAGVALDVYPFAGHGFRVTPGVLVYNANEASSPIVAQAGTSFTLNGHDYYSSNSNPVTGVASLNLHSQNPAFTITTGWGSFFPAKGGHWSFPFEIGVALIGSPTVNMALTSGQVCDYTYATCMNVTSDPQLQSDLQAQVAKYKNDLDPLKTFPVIGGGIVYNFRTRPH
jgi:hypothetical protein